MSHHAQLSSFNLIKSYNLTLLCKDVINQSNYDLCVCEREREKEIERQRENPTLSLTANNLWITPLLPLTEFQH
jgi:hypothetical protein